MDIFGSTGYLTRFDTSKQMGKIVVYLADLSAIPVNRHYTMEYMKEQSFLSCCY